jgi:D-alanyl-lipoteichoic acid acyltransferase DltB (MBOAT superfamily)
VNAPSLAFLGFGLLSALAVNLGPSLAWRRLLLLASNLIFFAFFAQSALSVLPYCLFLGLGYIAMTRTWRSRRTGVFAAALAVILLLFFWLKRYGFIPSLVLLPFPYVAIGLSYVFFRVLHLVIEAHQGGLKEKPSILSYLNYTLHFPALISGPIQLYPDFLSKETDERLPLDVFTIGEAAWRIGLGFFKVVIVSAILSELRLYCIRDLSPAAPFAERVGLSAAIWAVYPLFLYANFSGYTDFVVGVARLQRFELPENFDKPFIAENFINFWSRWHITLSNWLKTYVYMPILVATMRRYPSRKAEAWFGVLAYFVTFFLVGAWHGQTSMFLFFGVLQGGGVAANKLFQNVMTDRLGRKPYRALSANPVYRAVCRGLTFTWFAFTLIWFWSDWGQIADLLKASGLAAALLGVALVLLLAIPLLSVLAWASVDRPDRRPLIATRYWRTAAFTAMVLVVIMYQTISAGPAPDLVYKKF